MRSKQLWAVLLMLALAAGLERARGDVDKVPPSVPLDQLAKTIAGWDSTEVPLSADTLETLGKGVFLDRMYSPVRPSAGGDLSKEADGPVSLFIGYFPTQRTGQTIHSPQHCLPGAGWVFDESRVIEVTDGSGKKSLVGEYLISNGGSKAEVLYWYRSHGRTMASDWSAKLYTLADSILYSRTDAALIRIITPVQAGESQVRAHERALRFASRLSPMLPLYVPD